MAMGLRRWLFILFALSLAGCRQEYEDISSRPEFEGIVNSHYTVLQDLAINELTSDKNYQGPADYYAVTKHRLGGPEVLRTDSLKAGTKIEAKNILRCSNCPFGSLIVISLDIKDANLKPNIPVYLYRLRNKNPDEKIELDPRYFRK